MIVRSEFSPHPLLSNRHLQTVLPLWLSPALRHALVYEALELPDGDFVDLAWLGAPAEATNRPLLILFHGLEGSARSAYARRMFAAAAQRGWPAVMMHFRGCGDRLNRLARTYHSGDTADARFLLQTLQQRYPGRRLLAVGYSLGGNMLLKLCGELGANNPLRAAVSVCAPLRLDDCADRIRRGLSRLYQRHLIGSLRRKVLAKFAEHDYQRLIGLSRAQLRRLDSFWAFDDAFTAPIHGFADAKDYYARCSALPFIKDVRIPALVLQARDDPFMSEAAIPGAGDLGPAVDLEVTAGGGHVGFLASERGRPSFWLERHILGFLSNQLQTEPVPAGAQACL